MHMNSVWPKRVASLVVAFLLLFFIGYQIYNANFTKQKTETALYKTAQEKLQVTGYAVRDEQYLTSDTGGVLEYTVPDGGKVNKDGVVAQAYQSVADASVLHKKEALEQELKALQDVSGQGEALSVSAENIDSLLNDQLVQLLQTSSQPGADISDDRLALLKLLNEKQLSSGAVQNFSKRISDLQSQISQLSTQGNGESLGTVKTPAAGYFSSKTDGYEKAFSYDEVKELYPEDLKKIGQPATVPSNVVGRICSKFNWYFVCTVDKDHASRFKPETNVTIQFPFASNQSVQAEVVRVNQRSADQDAVVILESSAMDGSLINIRKETAEITLQTYEGIQVSQSAVHFETVSREVQQKDGTKKTESKSVEGVFVTYGSEIQFKQIVPLYSDGTYVYCDPSPDLDTLMTDDTIKLYDEVVIEGKDLYDGKVIE